MNKHRLGWPEMAIIFGLAAATAYAEPPTIRVQDFLTAMSLSEEDVKAAKEGGII